MAKKIRNLGPMINDGFPNCVHMPMTGIKGLPVLHVLVAMRTLTVGEQVLFSYGARHPVKLGRYINFASRECEEWFRSNPPLNLYKDYKDIIQLYGHETMKARSKISYLHYLLTTPSVQIILLLKKIITQQNLLELVDSCKGCFQEEEEKIIFATSNLSSNITNNLLSLFKNLPTEEMVKKIEFLFLSFPVWDVLWYLDYTLKNERNYQDLFFALTQNDNEYVIDMLQAGLDQKW